ncbi:hypothetical protein [Acidisoma sp. L85]|uniref:hypothetical protein n=1 Tax=Acidisoma sp. L85 TaxID=1641850 RepID=UPI00131D77EB|nr:hypothetical protein [Acidisoma sp. L85]
MNKNAALNAAHSGASRSSLGFEAFIIVRSKKDDDALVRLQSDPLLSGLRGVDGLQVTLHVPNATTRLVVDRPSCLIFHYNDVAAVQTIRLMQRRSEDPLVVCLGSDIYTYSRYTDLHDIVDLYMMPTEIHRKVLANGVYKPVYVLPECIDPITLEAGDEHPQVFPRKTGKRALWFGYSESFSKSMASLTPVILKNVADRCIDDFVVIVDQEGFYAANGNQLKVPTIPYDNATFRLHAKKFDYAILSHFSLDLKLNSHIKSPNKVITALLAGLIPIVSDTPNYREIFERHGLQKFLFSSAEELDRILKALDPVADSKFVQNSGVILSLLRAGSTTTVVSAFFHIIEQYRRSSNIEISQLPVVSYIEAPKPIGLREHLSDLLPSAIRACMSRLRRLWR